MNTAQLRQWLAAGKTERVLDELLPATADADTDLHHEATLLSARFENLTRQKRLGTLEFEDEARELAQINHALLDIITEMDRTRRQGGIPSWAKAAAAVLLVLGLLGGIGYAAGWFGAKTDTAATNTEQTISRDTPATQSHLPSKTEPISPQQEPKPDQPKVKSRTSGATTAQRKTTQSAPPPATVPQKQPATESAKPEPENTQSESGPRALPPAGEALSVNCKTNKGRLNIYYRAGQAIRFYVTANQPCYVRAIYQLADKRLVLLADNRPTDGSGSRSMAGTRPRLRSRRAFWRATGVRVCPNNAFPGANDEHGERRHHFYLGKPERGPEHHPQEQT